MKFTFILVLLVAFAGLFLDPCQLQAKSPGAPPQDLLDPPKPKPKPKPVEPPIEQPSKPENCYGSWHVPGEKVTSISKGKPIHFVSNQVPESEIVYTDGVFTLPNTGVYMITYTINASETSSFQLTLSNLPVVGGKLWTDGSFGSGSGTLTVMLNAEAGQLLQVINVGNSAKIGNAKKDTVSASISILQVR